MLNIDEVWGKAGDYIREKVGVTAFATWFAPLKPKLEGEHNITLEAPDDFFKEWVEKHYRPIIQEALNSSAAEKLTVRLQTGDAKHAPAQEPPTSGQPVKTHSPKDSLNLNPRYTFDNFVVGPSNNHAHAYSVAVAESPAKTYNPLFIYGGVGLGKTHLMQAICHAIKNKSPACKISYMPSEKFTNELIEAIRQRSTSAFRQKYRNVDVLVIDDIHFIAGKESTQEEFFHTFNTLYDAHKQIIISSDRPPKEIVNLQERLVSRFSWGLATDIQPPDIETRVAILKKKIEREPVSVPDEVIFFIAQLIKTNIRELEGALIRIIAYALLEEKPITLPLAREVLKDLLKEPKKLITVDFIQRCAAEEFGLSSHDLKSRRRNKNVVLPRQIAMYLSRELTDLSLPEIGESFGGKDHTTVLHSYKKIKESLKKSEELQNRVDKITRVIQQ
jgi:chromosomal replication initiator protein